MSSPVRGLAASRFGFAVRGLRVRFGFGLAGQPVRVRGPVRGPARLRFGFGFGGSGSRGSGSRIWVREVRGSGSRGSRFAGSGSGPVRAEPEGRFEGGSTSLAPGTYYTLNTLQ